MIIVADRANLFANLWQPARAASSAGFSRKVPHCSADVISKSWRSLLTQSAQITGWPAHWRHSRPVVSWSRRNRLGFGANPAISFCLLRRMTRGARLPIAMQDLVVCLKKNTTTLQAFCKTQLHTGALPRDGSSFPKFHSQAEQPSICLWLRGTAKRLPEYGAINISASAGAPLQSRMRWPDV